MSANGKEVKLEIRIAGAIDKTFGTSLSKVQQELNKTAKNVEATNTKMQSSFATNLNKINSDFTKLDKGFNNIMSVGKKCFKAVTKAAEVAAIAVGAVVGASIKVGSSFESAFAGVKKTVDATDEEFAQLRQDIIDMSTEIPSTADEIAGVMEIAGQLGIANDSLTEFTKTMINLGVSTNMTSEDAATALARFANITNMASFGTDGVSNWERLGATIVDLGNNFATTEEELVTMSYKLASTGSIVGLSEDQILGLAAAMSSVGIKADAGGSSMSKMLKKLQTAVETNGATLKNYASVAGMTTEAFAALFKRDAAEALVKFISGINDVGRNGKSAVAVLEDLDLKEIRLSNMLLALANSSDLMTEALDTANNAWKEGTALAVEAGKRYETLDSQFSIMKNTLKETGVAIYDELREPLVNVLQTVTDKFQGLTKYVKGPNGISKWVEDVSNALPTLHRKIKKYGGAILDFLSPLVGVGKWFLQNPKVIVSAIVGIGTALTAYKIASNVTHIVNAIVQLVSKASPVTLAISGVVAALGLLATAITAIKINQQQLIDDSLNNYFGDIALSLTDVQNIAASIVSSQSLDGVRKTLEAFEDLDGIAGEISGTVKELDKLNWKVGIGIELTEEEKDAYKAAIDEYVKKANEYVTSAQYAVSLNIELGGVNSDISNTVNKFYNDSREELEKLGKDLNDAVTNAFNDGLLEIDEISVITDIQKKMADIQKQMAVGDYEASLALLSQKYSGVNLTAESFQNLQDELNTQTAEATAAYEQAFKKNYASITATHNAINPETNMPYLSDTEYQKAINELQDQFTKDVAGVNLKAAEFEIEAINSYFQSAYNDALSKQIQEFSGSEWSTAWDVNPELNWTTMVGNAVNGSKDVRGATSQLLENMGPIKDELTTLSNSLSLDAESTTRIKSVLETINLLELRASGDWESIRDDLANAILLEAAESSAMYSWVDSTYTEMESRISQLKSDFDKSLNLTMSQLPENLQYKGQMLNAIPYINIPIAQNANGGLVRNKELSWLAESGPEMVVPLDGSTRAVSLWEQTGRLLGMGGSFDDLNLASGGSTRAVSLWEQTGRLLGMGSRFDDLNLASGGSSTITYSPTLQFYGDAPSKQEINEALKMSQDEFEAMMDNYIKRNRRMSFV